ncbi:hypothetical protein K438DRAFT_1069204 [Mycena galopus ATCC 62051]|nr:hypothetical protein K438DRAFT_1069204 [Mycena galopus ATCC 62051]
MISRLPPTIFFCAKLFPALPLALLVFQHVLYHPRWLSPGFRLSCQRLDIWISIFSPSFTRNGQILSPTIARKSSAPFKIFPPSFPYLYSGSQVQWLWESRSGDTENEKTCALVAAVFVATSEWDSEGQSTLSAVSSSLVPRYVRSPCCCTTQGVGPSCSRHTHPARAVAP